ncbi:hypothetical protein [Micromonospora matsumotoense]|nr:hypothetical protein [Micromonospora matsumotoense]
MSAWQVVMLKDHEEVDVNDVAHSTSSHAVRQGSRTTSTVETG